MEHAARLAQAVDGEAVATPLGIVVRIENPSRPIAIDRDALASLPGQKLFDRMADGDVIDAAIALAKEVADVRPLPLVRNLKATHTNPDGYFQFARNTVKAMAKNFPAPAKCVDAVEASIKRKFEDGMVYEREIFLALMMTPECKALRHAFFAERAASKIPDVPEDTPTRKIEKVAVVGVPDDTTGEAVKAFIVLRQGQEATADEIRSWAKDPKHGLTGYRAPKKIEFRDSLPETMVGKVLRRKLVEEEKAKAEKG